MITRDVSYGVSFGIGAFTLDPFLPRGSPSFEWTVGGLSILYAPPDRVCFALPATWAGGTKVAVGGLAHGANYEVGGLKKPVAADGTGFVRFVLQGNSTCLDLQDHARPQRR